MLAAVLVLLAWGAEPQCPVRKEDCLRKFIPEMPTDYIYDGWRKDIMCNQTTWRLYDYCHYQCPVRLVVTEPPEVAEMWLCLTDNRIEPWSPDGHIDAYHPLNNKEMDIVVVGNNSIKSNSYRGCKASDYSLGDGKVYDGKIALVYRGGCKYAVKQQFLQQKGAAVGILHDSSRSERRYSIGGVTTTKAANFPFLHADRHETDYIAAAVNSGARVRGHIKFECSELPPNYLDDPEDYTYPWDGCFDNEMDRADTCKVVDNAQQDRICEKCPLAMWIPGEAEHVCVMGNDLRPRKRETLLQLVRTLPFETQKDEAVYTTELPRGGCAASDFASLKGKMVFVSYQSACPFVHQARYAEASGVTAFVYMTRTTYGSREYNKVKAYSMRVGIPVHTVGRKVTAQFMAWIARGGGRHIPGVGYSLDALTFTDGNWSDTVPMTAPPLQVAAVAEEEDTSDDLDLTDTVTVVCLVVVVMTAVVMLGIVVKQRRDAVEVPEEMAVSGFAIPLKVASMAVSVSLLLITSLVTFSLVYVAGQDSTDTATANGRKVADKLVMSEMENTIELSNITRTIVMDKIFDGLTVGFNAVEDRVMITHNGFVGVDYDGSWSQFEAQFFEMFTNSFMTHFKFFVRVFTTRGFYMGCTREQCIKNDNRPDVERADGVVGTIDQTQDGWLYGLLGYKDLRGSEVQPNPEHTYVHPIFTINASTEYIGNLGGDPLAVTRGTQFGVKKMIWKTGRVQLHSVAWHTTPPIVAYMALTGSNMEGSTMPYHGTIAVQESLEDFIALAIDTARLGGSSLANMTVLVVDRHDRALLGGFNTGMIRDREFVAKMFTPLIRHVYALYTIDESPVMHVSGLARYLDAGAAATPAEDRWVQHYGEFDQDDYWIESPHTTLAMFSVENGAAVDTSMHHWETEVRDGGCGNCVVHDTQRGKDVLEFDGSTVQYVYRNLTRQAPVVERSRASAAGEPWKSKYDGFDAELVHADGRRCVASRLNSSSTASVLKCMLLPDFTRYTEFMVSMRIRPDVLYDEASPSATTPRLFTDSLVGETNFRLFGNGQIYLFVLQYGCSTAPYVDAFGRRGFPVGAWTTVTAVMGGGRCSLYVNGTLHARGTDSRGREELGSRTRKHSNPFYVGQFFKGRIDSLTFVRRYFPDTPHFLHASDEVRRNPVSKSFLVQTRTFDTNSDTREMEPFTVATMIPREDILRKIDATNMRTLQDLDVLEKNTNKALRQKANRTILVMVALVMASVVVFMLFNNVLTRPFEDTAVLMAKAAVLKISTVPDETSVISELRTMNRAIGHMLVNLKLYKSFMPQSVQLAEFSSDTEASVDAMSMTASITSRVSCSDSTCLGESSLRKVRGVNMFTCAIASKRFSYTVVNIKDFHAQCSNKTDTEVLELHSNLLEVFVAVFSKQKGVTEPFTGDRFACSFNAATYAASHQLHACNSAQLCRVAARKICVEITASVVTGEGRVGNMGTSVTRRFSFLSPTISWAYALERYCREREFGVLTDQFVYAEVETSFVLRIVDGVTFRKLPKPLCLFELLKLRDAMCRDEWMYQLEEADKLDPAKKWNNVAQLLFKGQFEVCSDLRRLEVATYFFSVFCTLDQGGRMSPLR